MKLVFALELMIVPDLLQSIISRSIDDLIFLGGLVIIRTTIAYFLNQEIKDVEAELSQASAQCYLDFYLSYSFAVNTCREHQRKN